MSVHPAALLYILFVGVGVPVLALRSARAVARAGVLPSRAAVARSVFVMFALLGASSWAVARAVGIPWAVIRPLTVRDALLALAALALLLAWTPFGWRTRSEASRRRALAMAPSTPGQAAAWIAVSVGAGVFEEIAWRGVLYALVVWIVRSPWAAVALCSLSFGIAHAVQGPRHVVITALVAVLFHLLVLQTGSLLPAMLVHALGDVIVGFLVPVLARRDAAAGRAPAA